MSFQRVIVRPDGSVTYRPALTRRVRLRLAIVRRIDSACGWLCGHGRDDVAVWIWRVCGLWSGR